MAAAAAGSTALAFTTRLTAAALILVATTTAAVAAATKSGKGRASVSATPDTAAEVVPAVTPSTLPDVGEPSAVPLEVSVVYLVAYGVLVTVLCIAAIACACWTAWVVALRRNSLVRELLGLDDPARVVAAPPTPLSSSSSSSSSARSASAARPHAE